MDIKLHVFNVNHGDSILVEVLSEEPKYILIDSNLLFKNGSFLSPAYEYLKSKNVKKINTLIVTHFHLDHYFGIEKFLNNFEIERVLVPPVFSKESLLFKKLVQKYKTKIRQAYNRTSEAELNKKLLSLSELLKYLNDHPEKVEEAVGKENVFRLAGINGTDFQGRVYLPLPRLKGLIREVIEKGNFELDNFPLMNDMSVAILLECFGKKILLTGDSTFPQWEEHRRMMAHDGVDNLDVVFLKASHHGSRENNNNKLYEYLFKRTEGDRYIFISANGRTHPHDEIFDLINKFNLKPYCTNLSNNCMATQSIQPKVLTRIPPVMATFIGNYPFEVNGESVVCQGDICLSLNSVQHDVSYSSALPCVYR